MSAELTPVTPDALLLESERLVYCPQRLKGQDPDEAQHYAIAGFELRSLPVLPEGNLVQMSPVKRVLDRFALFLRQMHDPDRRCSLALQIMADPDAALVGSLVRICLLFRAAGDTPTRVRQEVISFAREAYAKFPAEGVFASGKRQWLGRDDLKRILFQSGGTGGLAVAEISKHQERFAWQSASNSLEVVPHIFSADQLGSPWPILINQLARSTHRAAIRIELAPVSLDNDELSAVSTTALNFQRMVDGLAARQDSTAQSSGSDPIASNLPLARNDARRIAFLRRGAQVYRRMLAGKESLFHARILLVVQSRSSDDTPETARALLHGLRRSVGSALCAPQPEEADRAAGWNLPVADHYPAGDESLPPWLSLNLRWMAQTCHHKADNGNDWLSGSVLRQLVTAEEAVSLFHIPVLEREGETSALRTAATPFVPPPQVVSRNRYKTTDKMVSIGHVYSRDKLLDARSGTPVEFKVKLEDLEKPSLLVGAPGSGKSNLALSLLTTLWKEHGVPFLVLDPSTGQEYRYLYGDEELRKQLIVYTVGDEHGIPLRFNSFEVPPGITVANHISRLLACFKAAHEMWDPLPAIFEDALRLLYTGAPYHFSLHDTGRIGGAYPCLGEFAEKMKEHLNQSVLPVWGQGTENAQTLQGSTTIRVENIRDNLGHILNGRMTAAGGGEDQQDQHLFQNLLERPVVIELGALGDSTKISLVMSFLITQLVGHIEHAHRVGKRASRPHLLVIEEAHCLLSAETAATAGPHQGNTQGKSAQEINELLAVFRKFREGILVMDQRPSSLVGGVLDNSAINILTRLNDRVGFEHLSNVLNLNPAQQRFARTRLMPGDAIMLDRDPLDGEASGQPVLIRTHYVMDKLKTAIEQIRNEKNSRTAELSFGRANIDRDLSFMQWQPYSINVQPLMVEQQTLHEMEAKLLQYTATIEETIATQLRDETTTARIRQTLIDLPMMAESMIRPTINLTADQFKRMAEILPEVLTLTYLLMVVRKANETDPDLIKEYEGRLEALRNRLDGLVG